MPHAVEGARDGVYAPPPVVMTVHQSRTVPRSYIHELTLQMHSPDRKSRTVKFPRALSTVFTIPAYHLTPCRTSTITFSRIGHAMDGTTDER